MILFRAPWSTSSAIVYSSAGQSVAIVFAGNVTVAIPSVRITNTGISFTATEVGTMGVLNVTIPRTAVPSSSIMVYLDGIRNDNRKIVSDTHNNYVYFLLPYGTHLVELQFPSDHSPYLEYIIAAFSATAILTALFTVFRMRRQRGDSKP